MNECRKSFIRIRESQRLFKPYYDVEDIEDSKNAYIYNRQSKTVLRKIS